MPNETDYRERLYDSYVSGFTGARADGDGAPTLRADILRRLPGARDARILDAGCGNGVVVRLLLAAGYRRVTGIDVSSEQVALAHQMGTDQIQQADLRAHLQHHPGSYDGILLVDVLEHFDKPQLISILDAARSALAPGGRLVLRAPNAETPYAGRLRYGDFTHGVAFTHHSIRQLLLATGFTHVEVFPTVPAVHGPVSLVRRILWYGLAAVRKYALAVETGVLHGHIVSQNLVAVGYGEHPGGP